MYKNRVAMEEEEESEEFRLLEEYCLRRGLSRWGIELQSPVPDPGPTLPWNQSLETYLSEGLGPGPTLPSHQGPGPTLPSHQGPGPPRPSRHGPGPTLPWNQSPETYFYKDLSPGPTLPWNSTHSVVDCLTDIADSVSIADDDDLKTDGSSPEDQQDLVEKLVVLLKNLGDDINEKIQQDKVLQQQLCAAFSYSLFEKIMCCLWPPSTKGGRRQQIAWAFEVTSRLSAVDLIPKRRSLSFGTRFLRQQHSAWVQEHGGWDKVFSGEELD